MFAKKYLQKNNNVPLIVAEPKADTALIVVIPCLREPHIRATLESLRNCKTTQANVEVIVVINHSESQEKETKIFNEKTKEELDKWENANWSENIQFYSIGPLELKPKWAGAGLARKKGMDEAVRRFELINKPNGIIVSLDADTLVDDNYLTAIEQHFVQNENEVGATLAFEHQKDGLDPRQFDGINWYELYLKYYKDALQFTGYPYSMFTIGSAFAVRALAYVKRGGMNRRQAGEDFYFLQNLVQMGKVGEISGTKVYPSARLSDRVPFGTGPILKKWMNGEEDLSKTYNFGGFKDLKVLFDKKHKFFGINQTDYTALLKQMPASVSAFLQHDSFWNELNDLSKNCSGLATFEKRFFEKFNAFKILKYLNFVDEKFYQKDDLDVQIKRLNKEKQA